MDQPHIYNLRARLSPYAQRLDEAGKLRKLQATSSLANKVVRKKLRQSRARSKRYYDRAAKHRVMRIGQIVYLHNSARKPGISHKFTPVWKGPYQIQGRVGELDYKIVDVQGKESIVHVNRLKVARDPSIWKPKAKPRDPAQPKHARSPSRSKETNEASEPLIRPRTIVNHGLPAETPVTSPARDRDLLDIFDTPEDVTETPEQLRADQNYVPPTTPRGRFEQGTNRSSSPLTRSRARFHPEIPEGTVEN